MSTTGKRSSKGSGLTQSSSTPFGPPFDDADADVILQSSDQVDFHVYRIILSKSSSFFKSMFSLPQPDAASIPEKRPVIKLTENSRTIEVLLASIYPAVSVDTEPLSLADMIDALAAAKKYDMDAASQRLNEKFAVSKVVQDIPIEAFCVAYSNELGKAACVAAKASLKYRMNLDDIGDKLQYTNGPALYHLWKFHRACSTTAAEAVSGRDLTWITNSDTEPHRTWFLYDTNLRACICRKYEYKVGPTASPWFATAPWHNYITRAHNVLLQQPCAEAVAHDSVCGPSYKEEMCHTCTRGLFDLPEFIRLLGEEVERRLSMVDPKFPF
jgi:hypothetical protein